MAKHIHIHVHDAPIEAGPGQQLAKHVVAKAVEARDYGVPGMKKGQKKAEAATGRAAARRLIGEPHVVTKSGTGHAYKYLNVGSNGTGVRLGEHNSIPALQALGEKHGMRVQVTSGHGGSKNVILHHTPSDA